MIPAELHRVVPEHTAPEVDDWWARWTELHPTWEAHTWRDPLDPEVLNITSPLWEHCSSGAQLAGLVRLEVLWRRGGIYLDSDVEPLRVLDPLRTVGGAWCCSEDGRHYTDAVIGAEPEHPAIGKALDRAVEMIEQALKGRRRFGEAWPLPNAQATGPLNLTAAWNARRDVTILASRCFYPYLYTERERRHENFLQTSPDSFGVHHWAFSWEGS